MEDLSRPVETITIPLAIPVKAYLADHRVSGRVVLPAVEALQVLAGTLPAASGADVLCQEQGCFSRLLAVGMGEREIPVLHEFTRYADGRCRSRLMTVLSGRQAAWTRKIEHASVSFPAGGGREAGKGTAALPDFAAEAAAGPVFPVPAPRLYDELVPFGPAYRNVLGDLRLAPGGAWAELSGGAYAEAAGPLGSPFPFDAALHAACVWGQRYRGIVAFPVAFDRREIVVPTRPGETYCCRVLPLPDREGALCFDIVIAGAGGGPAEVVRGVAMRDISGGRRKPPAWVREER
ncbi:MAG: hotdog family protein [Syntrophales bacterium]